MYYVSCHWWISERRRLIVATMRERRPSTCCVLPTNRQRLKHDSSFAWQRELHQLHEYIVLDIMAGCGVYHIVWRYDNHVARGTTPWSSHDYISQLWNSVIGEANPHGEGSQHHNTVRPKKERNKQKKHTSIQYSPHLSTARIVVSRVNAT
jgi:electron transfer flavoprotein alpha subunit